MGNFNNKKAITPTANESVPKNTSNPSTMNDLDIDVVNAHGKPKLDDIEAMVRFQIQNCISSKSKVLEMIVANDLSCFPLFKFPYNLFYECSSNLIELDLAGWRSLQPRNYTDKIELDPTKIINTFPSNIFDHLPNLTSLNIAAYPFPYLSNKIGNLTKLKSFCCYGSDLICLPRSMYKLKKLKTFTPYTSYNIHYLPYEIRECPLNDTTISTGSIWNNYKSELLFPPLPIFPNTFVKEINAFVFNRKQLKKYTFNNNNNCCINIDGIYDLIMDYAMTATSTVNGNTYDTFCSHCKCDILINYVYYIWIFETVGTDDIGLLGIMCPLCIQKKITEKDYICYDYKKTDKDNHRTSYYIREDIRYLNKKRLMNAKGKIVSIKKIYIYETHDKDYYYIGPQRNGIIKYVGFSDYTMKIVSGSWVKFWRYNLNIDFDDYELCINKQTNEVNVKFIQY